MHQCPAIWCAAAIGLAAASNPNPAAADQLVLARDPQPLFQGGRFEGCQVEFVGLRDDPEYQMRPQAAVSGSLNLYAFQDRAPFLVVKLGVGPYRAGEPGTAFQPPTQVVLIDGFETSAPSTLRHEHSPQGGYSLTILRLDEMPATALFESASTGRFTVGYAMSPGGINATFLVDVGRQAAEGPRNNEAVGRWRECVTRLIDNALGPPSETVTAAERAADEAAAAAEEAAAEAERAGASSSGASALQR